MLGLLPEPSSWDASFLHNDIGALQIQYSRHALGGDILKRGLEQGLEIAVQVGSDTTKWVEPDNGRFILTKRTRNALDDSDTVTLSLPSYSWLFNKMLNMDTGHLVQDGDNKGKRAFLSSTPGTILRTLLQENWSKYGVWDIANVDFDTAKDSAGASWAKVYTLYYSLGTSLNSIVSSFVGGSAFDWRVAGRKLKVWNADSTALCRQLDDSIVLQFRTDVSDAPEEETIEELASDVLVTGDNGLVFEKSNTAAPTPWGRWQSYYSQGGVSDKGTAENFMQAQLEMASRVRGQYTRSVLLSDVESLPLLDYHPGDWITAPTVNHGEKVRVQQITLSVDESGNLSASLTLNDKFYDSSIRQYKRIVGITGGAVLAGSQNGTVNTGRDHRVPKAPEGLVLSSGAYVDDQGNALGVVYARWGEVSQATDNTSIEIADYRVEWRYGDEADHWRFAGLTGDETLSWGGLDCGRAVVVRVRAIPTYSDKPGEWSGTVSVTVESDVTPPSIPSMPVLESELGVVRVRSDGLNHVGGGFEPDTAYLAVGRSASNGSWTGVGRIPVGGMWTDIGLSMGQTYWYALRAVDRSGNASGWSHGASIRVASAVTQDELDGLADRVTDAVDAVGEQQKVVSQVQTDLNAAKQQITANKTLADTGIEQAKQAAQAAAQAAASAQTTADGRNRIFHDWRDPTLSGAEPVAGDLWYRYQRFWTTSQGEPDNSPSLCANFYTYAQGEPDNSPSVLVPLESEIVEVLVWDGDSWNTFTLVASDVIASGSVSAELVDAEFFHGRTIVGGTYTTEGENVVINDTGILFQDDAKNPKLSFAKDGSGKWVLTVRDGIQSGGTITGSMLQGVTVTGSTVQTSGEDRRGVKITDAGLAAYDGAGAANTVIDATTGRITMNGALISQGGIVSPTITGGVITGALFRSSESAYPRFELSGTDLDMWDSARNHTVHLDGDGETSWLTGTFQTAVSGKRVLIDPDFHTSIVGDPGNTQTGVGISFVPDGAYARAPYIGTEFEDSDRGLISTICLNGGMRTDGSGGANTGFGSFMRLGQYRNGGTESAEIYATTKTDYLEQSADTSRREWYTALRMHNRSGNGSYAQLYAHKPGSRYANVYAWANDSNNSGRTYAGIEASDQNGSVGVQACIDTGYLHLGGYLGGFTGRATVQALNWRWGNGMGHGQTVGPSTYTFGNPAKYGAYNGVANADVPFGSIFAHVCNTGSASRGQVMGFNAGTANYTGDVYCSVVSWLRA